VDQQAIIKAIDEYLMNDVDYTSVAEVLVPGAAPVVPYGTFEISNTIPAKPIAPYYRVDSIEQAHEIFTTILYMHDEELDELASDLYFNEKVQHLTFDPEENLYLSIYYTSAPKAF